MSELIQSGQHPDADQLSAFVEQALPAHERELTLAHLASCADCRAIVALSLPPLDEVAALQPEPARRPWLSGWNLAWPAATIAALAALVFFIVHLHNAAPIKSNTPPTEVATSRPPAPLPVESAPPVSTPAPAAKPVAPKGPVPASTARAGVSAPSSPSTAMLDQGVVNGRLENPGLLAPPQGQGAAMGGAINGANGAPMPAVATAPQSPAAIPPNAPQPNIVTAGNAESAAPLAAQAKTPPIPYSQPRATAASPQVTTAGAASVDSGANVIGATNTINGYNIDPNTAPARLLLPSRLPMLSTARNGHQVLAIDTQNAVFYSEDDGKHWVSVPSQWGGRALRVVLAHPAAPAITGSVASFSAGAISAAPARAPGNATLSGTITDATGAVVSGASVTISDAANKVVYAVTSDRDGHYLVDNLSPGSYELVVMAAGFQKQQLAVSVVASQQNQQNLTLAVGQASETVTVEAKSSAVALAAPRAALKKAATAAAAKPPVAIFEISTDTGERWSSPDGKTWTKR